MEKYIFLENKGIHLVKYSGITYNDRKDIKNYCVYILPGAMDGKACEEGRLDE